jgi:hypothetical protein
MTVSEVETQQPEWPSAQELIQQALDQDYNKANKTFGSMMTIKLDDLLDQEKIRLADQIFNGASDDDNDDDVVGDEDGIDQLELDLETEGESEADESGDEEDDEVEEEDDDVDDVTDEEVEEMLDEIEDEK